MPVEGWVPGVSRSFPLWQPAPRLGNTNMAATIEQPSHEISQKEEVKQAPIILKNISEERMGREAWAEKQAERKLYNRKMLHKGNSTCH